MSSFLRRARRALNLREGEGRVFVVLAGYAFLGAAVTIILSAVKNGLFLSVYPSRLIPHAMVGAALVAAVAAIALSGVIPRFQRRTLADGLTAVLIATLVASRVAFAVRPATAFALFIGLTTVEVLILTHMWDFASSFCVGRQAKRLMPLVGMGASTGILLAGFAVSPAAVALGTENLLLVAAGLLAVTLPLIRQIREPSWEPTAPTDGEGGVAEFLRTAGRGLRSLRSSDLLRLLAVATILLVVVSTLIDFQLKLAVQERFGRDRITAIYGMLFGVIGIGTIAMQLVASRVVLPRFGISTGALGQSGTLAATAAALAVVGSFWLLVLLQVLEEVLEKAVGRAVEQVSLLPFPPNVKSAAHTTLHGVIRPLSTAVGGVIALLFVTRSEALPYVTALGAGAAFFVLRRHRPLYIHALQEALSKRPLEFESWEGARLVMDEEALGVVDAALREPDPTVVVFALSLLEEMPAEQAAPRAIELLDHEADRVRAEAARILGRMEGEVEIGAESAVTERLEEEASGLVVASLVATLGAWRGAAAADDIVPFLDHPEPRVRRTALATLGEIGWEETRDRLEALLQAESAVDRSVALRAIGDVGEESLLPAVSEAVAEPDTRPAALEALGEFGVVALPVLESLLGKEALPLPARRMIITTLAGIADPGARDLLVGLLDHAELGPAALTSLRRMRKAGKIAAIEPAVVRPVLRSQSRRGLRYALAAAALARTAWEPKLQFVASELEELRDRAVHRTLALLALSYDHEQLGIVEMNLFSSRAAERSNALELLEGAVKREDGALAVPLAEAATDGGSPAELVDVVPDGRLVRAEPLRALLDESEWWPRALGVFGVTAAEEASGEGEEGGTEGDPSRWAPKITEEDTQMIPTIEKVMLLKGSEFFRAFPGEELAGVAEMTSETYLEPDEVIFREGDRGDAFYMVVRGGIRITREGHELAILGPREGFGEMAILDQETRSATATATEATTLLRIDRDDFDRLVESNPAIARGIYRVLTERLRSTLAKIAAG